jgi:hypothetical protein
VQTRSQSEAHSGTTPLTTFTVEATPADGSMRNCRFRLLVEARPRKGGPFYRIESQHRNAHCQSPVVLETRLRLPAGVWQARVVVEDRDVGAIGAVLHTFTVP